MNAADASNFISYLALGCHKWVIRPEKCDKLTPATWKNLGFQLFSSKTGQRRTNGLQNFRIGQLLTCQCSWGMSNLIPQMRSWKMSVKLEKRSGQSGMSNLFERIQRIPLFLTKLALKFLAKNVTECRSIEWCSCDECVLAGQNVFQGPTIHLPRLECCVESQHFDLIHLVYCCFRMHF